MFNNFLHTNRKKKFKFPAEPAICFGRYTDRNKTKTQYEHWDKSLNLYKYKKYLDAYEHFFNYLEDKTTKNVLFKRENNRINFQFVQGSKIVKGSVNSQEIFAEAEVVRFDEISIPIMRKLLSENYNLYYSKFVIKNDVYSLKYYSPVEDANPKSLYNALKELATNADMFDDVLIDEFDFVQPINMEHINEIPPKEKQIKLKYLRMWVKNALVRTESLDTDQQAKEILFILQILLFKIYYLLAPEGTLLSDIRYLQKSLLNKNVHTIKELNFSIIEALKEIKEKDDDELMKSLYKVEATFAVNRPTNFNYVKKFISNELAKVTIILNEGKEDEALKVCEYILSYSSFTFGMPAVAYDLLQIIWRIFYPSYFNELGFIDEYYSKQTSFFNNELIKAKIDNILNNAKKLHKKIKFRHGNLDFSDKLKFIISFFNEFQSLNYD